MKLSRDRCYSVEDTALPLKHPSGNSLTQIVRCGWPVGMNPSSQYSLSIGSVEVCERSLSFKEQYQKKGGFD
jgi:hypothetical protein